MVVFGGGVAQVQLQGVPHVQCPMRPPTSPSDPHLRYSNKLDISLPRSTRYSDCSYGPISVYSGYPPQLHIGLQQISDLSRVLYSRGWFSRYWAEVKSLDFRSRPRSGLEFPCLRLLLSDKSFSSLFSLHICSQCCKISKLWNENRVFASLLMFVVFPANPTNPSPKAHGLHLAVLVFPTTLLSDPIVFPMEDSLSRLLLRCFLLFT